MNTCKKLLIAFSFVFLAGCQAMIYGTANDFEKIHTGMSKADVITAIGSPVSVSSNADKGEEVLIYKRMSHAISAWAKDYEVVLRGDKVVRYGEKPTQ